MMDVPAVNEFITSEGARLICNDANCNWNIFLEPTENQIQEIQEFTEQHQQWHEEGMPQ